MNLEDLRRHLLSLPGAAEDFPFAPDIPVYKVMGKMFAYVSPQQFPPLLTIKLDPLHGQMLRGSVDAVRPGYHMNKEHWNTIEIDGSVTDDELLTWIDESYELVVAGLTRAQRAQLEEMRKE